ncbi:MAG: ABC transporter permease [Hellea sp.]|nr:ABC transporter permease [Hellea sp.]
MLQLLKKLTEREISLRYKGSIFGLSWAFITPLLMFAVYAFVFSSIFKSKWGTDLATGDRFEYSLLLFTGLIVHAIFSECLLQSSTVISGNSSYVKKVIFPIQILPIVKLNSAIFHAIISIFVLLIFQGIVSQSLPWTAVLTPVVLLPFLVFTLGVSWFLSALGVYVRDISQVLNPFVTACLFVGPVLYPRSVLPESLQPYLSLNPLTVIVEQMQSVLIWGKLPDFTALGIYTIVAVLIAGLGWLWFQKLRPGFADVL